MADMQQDKQINWPSAGFTKREVVEWALGQGFTRSDVADAVGISLEELQQGKY